MVSECRPDEIEAYALGELGEADAARVSAHLDGCAACAEELRWLRRERRLFAARAGVHPAPPPLSAVLARAFEALDADEAAEAAPARPSEPAPMGPARPARGAAPRGRGGTARARRGGGAGTAHAVMGTAGRVLVAAVVLALPLALCLPRGGEAPLAEEPRASATQEVKPEPTSARAELRAEADKEAVKEDELPPAAEQLGACGATCTQSGDEGSCGEGHPGGVACAEMGGAECGAEATCCVTSDEQRP